jgi:hypothetical protein
LMQHFKNPKFQMNSFLTKMVEQFKVILWRKGKDLSVN